ncbi:MAG: alanine--tRNA ligase, partial [Firmicutes bacterium]|nr:alanine--tRNA ligase [Bacillota bacterium]
EAMTDEQIREVEKIVNEQIDAFLPVTTDVMAIGDAQQTGAIGLFDSKYGDDVRVVSIGDFSKELCGGVHVSDSGQIGAFRILSESGIASGVRRIEAVTGQGLLRKLEEADGIIEESCSLVKANPDILVSKIENILAELKETKAELAELKGQMISNMSGDLIGSAEEIGGVRVITKAFDSATIDELRKMSDEIKASESNVALVFAAVNDQKVTFMISLTDDVVGKGFHAGKIIKDVAKAAGGGGGGKADMAQAGGKDPSKVDDAFAVAKAIFAGE